MAIAYLLFLHFVGDWLAQGAEMAKRKSEVFRILLGHCLLLSIVFFLGSLLIFSPINALIFTIINVTLHGIIDWNIWSMYKWSIVKRNPSKSIGWLKKNYQYWNDTWFINTLGFDQLLHAIILIISYQIINHKLLSLVFPQLGV